ncbi:hypothetical protein [Kitasatospora sp. NPDC057015]|uniref:hypothetical protein n=1 Tax=Kitasatospora sp. NPDC057015 TaxID=3346001 RepID=UPI003632C5B3
MQPKRCTTVEGTRRPPRFAGLFVLAAALPVAWPPRRVRSVPASTHPPPARAADLPNRRPAGRAAADRPANVNAAALGMTGVLYRGPADLRSALGPLLDAAGDSR